MFELFDPAAEIQITKGTNLPHWFQKGVTYFVTFRTADSIPEAIAQRWYAERSNWLEQRCISIAKSDWKDRLAELPVSQRKQFHETFSGQFMEYLDKGWGACVLRRSELSKIIADSLMFFDGSRYLLGDFVVMPNHVHLLVCPRGEFDVRQLCFSWKKFSAGKINKMLGTTGRFWQEDSFDHLVRSPSQFEAVQRYIAENPAKLQAGTYHLRQLPE